MSYYYKEKNGKIHTESYNQFTDVYSGFRYCNQNFPNTFTYLYGTSSPWFALKDANYVVREPVFEIVNNKLTLFGLGENKWHLPIMTYTISSLSGKYYLDGTIAETYRVPFDTQAAFKVDFIYSDKINISDCDYKNGAKLSWCISNDNIKYYNAGTQGPTRATSGHEGNTNNIFNQNFLDTNCKIIRSSLILENTEGHGSVPLDTNVIFIKNQPNVFYNNNDFDLTGKFGFNNTNQDDSDNYVPPYFTLNLSALKEKYTKLKLKCIGMTIYGNSWLKQSLPSVNKDYIYRDYLILPISSKNGDLIDKRANHFQWIWQNNDSNTWISSPSSDTFECSFNGRYDYVYSGTTYDIQTYWYVRDGYTTETKFWNYMNGTNAPELHYKTDENYWKHIVPLKVEPSHELYKYNLNGTTGYCYVTSSTEEYNKELDGVTLLEKITTPNYQSAFSGVDENGYYPIDTYTNDNWKQYTATTATVEYNHIDNWNSNFMPGGVTFALSDLWNGKFSNVVSSTNSDEWTDNYLSGCTPSANICYTIGQLTNTYTIDISTMTGNYLHISYPATKLFSGGPPGLLYQVTMTFEGL